MNGTDDAMETLKRLGELETVPWNELHATGSHSIPVSKLIRKAQRRLESLKLDDFQEIYSLRMSGKKRLWGIRVGSILRFLWWDPEHKICPSKKKHT